MNSYSACIDFDGTVCIPDSCDYLLSRFAPDEWKALDDAVWRGELTEREAFPRQIELLRVTWEDARKALCEGVRIREGFAEFVEFCRVHALPLMILSGGLKPLIAELLRKAGVPDVPFISHGAEITGERWNVVLWEGTRYGEHCSHCKCSYLFTEKRLGRNIIYIGDGYTDLCPAQHADVLFATGNLARECAKAGRPFIPFETFMDIERRLESLFHSEQDLRR